MRLKAIVEYEGSAYHGFQRQPEIPTVQSELEKAMKKFFNSAADFKYASRTDAGVHSKGQVISFSCPDKFTPRRAEKALNYYLPEDIILKETEECSPTFNPRYDNNGKLYVYRIMNSKYNDYRLRNFVWHIEGTVNWEKVGKGINLVKGRHDFSLFSSAAGGKKNPLINLRKVELRSEGDLYCLHYEADYFLMHMIRHLTGFLVGLGRGKEGIEDLRRKLRPEGPHCCRVAPPKGLELKKVYL